MPVVLPPPPPATGLRYPTAMSPLSSTMSSRPLPAWLQPIAASTSLPDKPQHPPNTSSRPRPASSHPPTDSPETRTTIAPTPSITTSPLPPTPQPNKTSTAEKLAPIPALLPCSKPPCQFRAHDRDSLRKHEDRCKGVPCKYICELCGCGYNRLPRMKVHELRECPGPATTETDEGRETTAAQVETVVQQGIGAKPGLCRSPSDTGLHLRGGDGRLPVSAPDGYQPSETALSDNIPTTGVSRQRRTTCSSRMDSEDALDLLESPISSSLVDISIMPQPIEKVLSRIGPSRRVSPDTRSTRPHSSSSKTADHQETPPQDGSPASPSPMDELFRVMLRTSGSSESTDVHHQDPISHPTGASKKSEHPSHKRARIDNDTSFKITRPESDSSSSLSGISTIPDSAADPEEEHSDWEPLPAREGLRKRDSKGLVKGAQPAAPHRTPKTSLAKETPAARPKAGRPRKKQAMSDLRGIDARET